MYVFNVLRFLNKNFKCLKDPKVKPSQEEIDLAKSLIQQINDACNVDEHQVLYNQFKESKLSKSAFLKKFKKSKSKLNTAIKRFEVTTPYEALKDIVNEKFKMLREDGVTVHGNDLCRMATEESSKLCLKRKCSSISFVNSIKKKYNIGGRRVQKKRTKTYSKEEIESSAANFYSKINQLVIKEVLKPCQIFNADQTGINLEITDKRTLDYVGTKEVVSKIISDSNTTHSFTVQLYFSMNRMGKTVFLIFKGDNEFGKEVEKNGKTKVVGARIQAKLRKILEKCKNVEVFFNSCAKMDKPAMNKWMDVFEKDNQNLTKKLLIWDALSVQTKITQDNQPVDEDECESDEYNLKFLFENSKTLYETIPAGTTSIAQPLDSRFILQFKYLYKYLYKLMKHREESIIDKYWIIKLVSVVYNQFSSPKFERLIEYCWSVCNYVHPDLPIHNEYGKVIEINLSKLTTCYKCNSQSVVRCAHCNYEFCLEHFIIEDQHLHL